MKKKTLFNVIIYYSIIGLLFSFASADSNGQTSDDTLKIKSTCLDYIEGWYEGNPLRLKQSLHKKLAKRQIQRDPVSQKTRIRGMNDRQLVMIANISSGGIQVPEYERNISIQILDISGNTACVKVNSRDFREYLHLARVANGWAVVNIIWEMNQPDQEGGSILLGLVILCFVILILSPFLVWPIRYFVRHKADADHSGCYQYCADRPLISRLNLVLTIFFIGLFFIYGGWILYIICMLSIPNILWCNWISWNQKFWSTPGRIYYSILSLFILVLDFVILLQFNIL